MACHLATLSRMPASPFRLSELADFVNGKNFTKGAAGHGRPVIRTPGYVAALSRNLLSDVDAADENIAREGDMLFVWSGSLTVGRWMWEDGLINQHVFKVLPKPESHHGLSSR